MTEFLDIRGTVDLQDLQYKTIEVDMQDFPMFTIDKIDLWELTQIPHMGMKLAEGTNIRRVYVRRRGRNSGQRQM